MKLVFIAANREALTEKRKGEFGVRSAIIQAAILLSVTFLIGELGARVLSLVFIQYDVEMARYTVGLQKRKPGTGYGFTHAPNKTMQLMGVSISTNKFGLRDSKSREVNSDKYRIVALGDSLTLGWGVPAQESFVSVLEQKLSKNGQPLEFINLGHGGYNTSQSVHFLLEEAQQFQPDHLVYFFFINDAEMQSGQSPYEFLAYSHLLILGRSSYRTVSASIFGSSQSYLEHYTGLYSEDSMGWKTAKESMLKLINFAESKKVKLQVVLLPELHNLAKYPFSRQHQIVRKVFESRGVEVIDLVDLMPEIENPFDFWVAPDDAHPNAEAHFMFADILEPLIQQEIDR